MMSVSAGLHVGGGDSGAWCERVGEMLVGRGKQTTLRRNNSSSSGERDEKEGVK